MLNEEYSRIFQSLTDNWTLQQQDEVIDCSFVVLDIDWFILVLSLKPVKMKMSGKLGRIFMAKRTLARARRRPGKPFGERTTR